MRPSEESHRFEPYERPALIEMGTVHALTQTGCFYGKTLGRPDFMFHVPVPIANCST